MIMKHISGWAHDVCVPARGRDGPDCWLRPPDRLPPYPLPLPFPFPFPFPLPNFSSLCSSGQCGMLKRDLEAGGGGEYKPPSSAWEGQDLRGREILRRVGRG